MRDITHKQSTLRTARAVGILFCSAATIELIQNEKLPKGNLFDGARAAGFLGAKATPQLLPHCHPVAIDGMEFGFEFLDRELHSELFGETVALKILNNSISPLLPSPGNICKNRLRKSFTSLKVFKLNPSPFPKTAL